MGFTSEKFQINGINSSDIGVDGCALIRTESEISYPLMGDKSIISDKIRYNDIPYFYGTDKSPIEFDLKFSLLEQEFTEDRLFELGLIFAQDRFVEFRSCDFIGKIFYVVCTSMQLITFGSQKGWLNVHMVNIAPHAFSEKFVHDEDLTNETLPYTFEIDAKFNVMHPKYGYYYFPEIEFELLDLSVSFTLTNMSDGNRITSFTGLQALENIKVNNALKEIESSTGLYRLNNFNKNWFRLPYGKSILKVNERCKLRITGQYPIYI